MESFFRTKIVYDCIHMRDYLLNWNFGRRMKLVTKKGEISLRDILFDLLDDEELWDVFNKLKITSSQAIG